MKNVCILLVLATYVYHNARFEKRKTLWIYVILLTDFSRRRILERDISKYIFA